jgi:hypothetical protein
MPLIIGQQFFFGGGYEVEEKLRLRVHEQKMLSTPKVLYRFKVYPHYITPLVSVDTVVT